MGALFLTSIPTRLAPCGTHRGGRIGFTGLLNSGKKLTASDHAGRCRPIVDSRFRPRLCRSDSSRPPGKTLRRFRRRRAQSPRSAARTGTGDLNTDSAAGDHRKCGPGREIDSFCLLAGPNWKLRGKKTITVKRNGTYLGELPVGHGQYSGWKNILAQQQKSAGYPAESMPPLMRVLVCCRGGLARG